MNFHSRSKKRGALRKGGRRDDLLTTWRGSATILVEGVKEEGTRKNTKGPKKRKKRRGGCGDISEQKNEEGKMWLPLQGKKKEGGGGEG